jgi:hypothetical protein
MTDSIMNNGVLGIVSTTVGIFLSYQQEIEFGMRMASLCVGMTVGLLSAYHIFQKIKYDQIKRDKEAKDD